MLCLWRLVSDKIMWPLFCYSYVQAKATSTYIVNPRYLLIEESVEILDPKYLSIKESVDILAIVC